ncbi:succinate dehydrogenase assembly factor 4 [Azospirillum canadense]|uniref:succinate dehydrogenase assembly factor 4 n=1 Tax=Azospirillum canadense TaxID=403962 RepID=UPI0022268377|nr:DUF1674 domain-containing protein [Azospirillum canadense]MCW2238053.1 hypothetical protein [Azospirillum canadense]
MTDKTSAPDDAAIDDQTTADASTDTLSSDAAFADISEQADTETVLKGPEQKPGEIGGPKGPEPTRYGDWEFKGRCSDF